MSTQNILQKGPTKLGTILDNSEYYDYQLVDISEINLGKIDIVLDFSEFYDYTLGDNNIDYIYREIFGVLLGDLLTTEDDYTLTTEDNYYIQWQ
jgi:hypothetical protein